MTEAAESRFNWKAALGVGAAVAVMGTGAFLAARLHTAAPHQMFVRSGLFVPGDGLQVGRRFVRWPWQYVKPISLEAVPFTYRLEMMTSEKLTFEGPVLLSVSPILEEEALKAYARRLLPLKAEERQEFVWSLLQGTCRAAAAGMAMETIFKGRAEFMLVVQQVMQTALRPVGLQLLTAQLKHLEDGKHSAYFKEQSRDIQAKVKKEAEIKVSEQEKDQTIGVAELDRQTKIRVAALRAETTKFENECNVEVVISNAKLGRIEAEQELVVKQAAITADMKAQELQAQREEQVQAARAKAQVETERAAHAAKAKVEAEIAKLKAEGEGQAMQILADASLFQELKKAEGMLALAKAEAEGQKLQLQARAQGFAQIAEVLKQCPALLQWQALDEGTLVRVAQTQADALVNMKPNLMVLGETGDSVMKAVRAFLPASKMLLQDLDIQALLNGTLGNKPVATNKDAPDGQQELQAAARSKHSTRANSEP